MPQGRRHGASGTRERIVGVARRQFAARGYERTSLRSLATAAGVDQRLVTYFFGSKRGLFLAAMSLPVDPTEFVASVTAAGLGGLGERLATRWIELWDSAQGRHLVGLIRAAASNKGAARMLRDVFVHVVLRQLIRSLDVDRVERRASLVATQLFGLVFARYVLRLPEIAAMTPSDVGRMIGPMLQRYLED